MSAATVTLEEAKQRRDEAYERFDQAWDELNTAARLVANALVDGAVDLARDFAAEYTEARAAWERTQEENRQARDAYRAILDATT